MAGERTVSAFIDTAESSTDSPEYVNVEARPDGSAWLEIYRGGRSLGVELDAAAVERLRQTPREAVA